METGNRQYFFVEALVVALVVFSAFAIYSNDSEDNNNDLQLTSVTGNVELSTRDSMDAFGLQDFSVGAVASLDLTVSEVVVLDCADCNTTTNGVMISGDIVITELLDQQGRLGRVEGLLNFTHFVTSSGLINILVLWSAPNSLLKTLSPALSNIHFLLCCGFFISCIILSISLSSSSI